MNRTPQAAAETPMPKSFPPRPGQRPRSSALPLPAANALLLVVAALLLAAAALLLVPGLHAFPAKPPDAAARIPEVHVLSFSGDRVDLPSMLEGKVAILILSFSKGARPQATSWGRRLPTDYFYSTNVLYFEMPVLEAVPRLLRSTVLRAIKSEVSVRSQPHFAPLTTDEALWRNLVRYNHPDDAYVLLIDSTGRIRAQSQGEPDDIKYQDLKRNVDLLLAPAAH